jgi:YidC/Oxa1 family membrane protein insertase
MIQLNNKIIKNKMLMQLYTTVLYQPLFNLLVFFYNILPDIGIAIILLTIIVKVIIWPLSHKGLKSQKVLQDLQPKLEVLKAKYKDNKEKLGQETMALYKKEKINPMASCLPLLIQFPIIIAVFRVFRAIFVETVDFSLLYSFVHLPETINPMMLGFLDLSKPQIVLAILAGLAQFWQSRIMLKKTKKNDVDSNGNKKELSLPQTMSKQMMYFMPIITVFIAASFPGGLALYWLVITLLGVLDQYLINRSMEKPNDSIPTSPSTSTPEVIDVQ